VYSQTLKSGHRLRLVNMDRVVYCPSNILHRRAGLQQGGCRLGNTIRRLIQCCFTIASAAISTGLTSAAAAFTTSTWLSDASGVIVAASSLTGAVGLVSSTLMRFHQLVRIRGLVADHDLGIFDRSIFDHYIFIRRLRNYNGFFRRIYRQSRIRSLRWMYRLRSRFR